MFCKIGKEIPVLFSNLTEFNQGSVRATSTTRVTDCMKKVFQFLLLFRGEFGCLVNFELDSVRLVPRTNDVRYKVRLKYFLYLR